MNLSPIAQWALRIFTWLGLAFLYLPLVVVVILSFNSATSLSWPPRGFTLDWWSKAWEADEPREAFITSISVTAVALQNSFSRRIDLGIFDFQVGFGFHSVVIAHATFCVVIAYNNVVARLRRMSPNLLEASADLGAGGVQTFRLVTFPLIRSALLAGGILAFALSFDEIVVTTFTSGPGVETLPQWILNNLTRPNNVPLVTVVATVVMLLSIPLAW